MIRDGSKAKYTDEDKKNLVIRQHTPEEIRERKRWFSKKQWKRRIIMILVICVSAFLTWLAPSEILKSLFMWITILTTILAIMAEFIILRGKKEARSPYYVELLILEKMGVEWHNNVRSDHINSEYFYPVKAMDTTSKYECIYYLSQDEHKIAESGKILKVNLLPKELKLK